MLLSVGTVQIASRLAITASPCVDALHVCADNEHTVHPGIVMSEDAGLRVRVDDTLRRSFIEVCKARDTTAAQVLRAFMRWYVEKHGEGVYQPSLFDEFSPEAGASSMTR